MRSTFKGAENTILKILDINKNILKFMENTDLYNTESYYWNL